MSFILDALRKSDQQRQRSATPTLMTAQTPTTETRQPALFWYGVIAAVLVGAGILIGWMHQWQADPVVAAAPPIANSKSLEASPPKVTLTPSPALLEPTRLAVVEQPAKELPAPPQATPAPSPAEASKPTKIDVANPQPAAAVAAAPKVITPVHDEPVRSTPTETTREASVMALPELPPALQQEIPKLAILAHSYSSKPKSRFVYINDRMWHEEESPAPGLKLEQITPDGMIFSYKGYRFRRGANP